eukprot:gnl/MRDRNA2_/MRDRNA2_121127_c0_seq1.p1 gnl/MRDRNA2_/MRDRNA2_121127_c0~~gnl/MRDRNA2_/MRDRNA2_121127_c0_seq1.p1  ORF type:complete len:218 (+),score=28.47 gnl/MRDRNA2_/MRDRNA2_121127_c0_seq1:75-728(+)
MDKMSQQRMQVSHLITRNKDTSTATIHLGQDRLRGELCPVPGLGPPAFSDTLLENRPRDSWLRDNFKRPTADHEVFEAATHLPRSRYSGSSALERERAAAHPAGANGAWKAAFMSKHAHEISVSHPTTRHVFSAGVSPPRASTPGNPLTSINMSDSTSPRKGLQNAGGAIAQKDTLTPRRPDEDIVGRTRMRNTTKTYRFERHFYFTEKPFIAVGTT